jgi:type II secretory pathway predicted ATPase ExeA
MNPNIRAYQMTVAPIILKQLLIECGINQVTIAAATNLARTTINLTVNRGYLPVEHPDFQSKVESLIRQNPKALAWLIERGLTVASIWDPLGHDLRWHHPAGHGVKIAEGQKRIGRAAIPRQARTGPGDPEQLTISWEVEMINQETLKHFKIFRSPFIDDIQKDGDIYMSEEHRYIEAAMLDAARHGGFLAVIGEVGSGKSVMRRKVVEQLRKDGDTLVIYPQIIDKTRLNAASVCDAIIMDVSDQKPRMKLEQKTRQVHSLLLERSKQGFRAVLIVEEAHDLHTSTLKYLKRFYELEDGYRKLLGIILVGQVELKSLFNETTHVEMREVIRRIQVAEIRGLNGHIANYLELKFKRVGAKVDDIFEAPAISALGIRLTSLDRQNKKISHAYPLVVNNYAARAMNLAYEMGEARVTEAVVMAI